MARNPLFFQEKNAKALNPNYTMITALLRNKNVLALADQAVMSGSSLALTILLARTLGATAFGLFATLLLVIYLLVSVLNALVVQPLQVSHARMDDQSSYISFSFWSQLALVVVLFLITSLLFSFDQVSNAVGRTPNMGEMLFVVGFLMHDYFRKVLLATGAITKALILDSVTAFFMLAMAVVGSRVGSLGGALALSYLPAFLIGMFYLKPFHFDRIGWANYFNMHCSQGKWLVLTAAAQWWSGNLFVVASGVFLGVEALGAFRLVQSLFGVLNILLQSFENYVLPEATRLYLTSASVAKAYLRQISTRAALVFGIVLVPLFVFAKDVICLAGGADYAPYAYVVRGMTLLYSLIFIGYPIRIAIRMLLLNSHFFNGYLLSLVFSLLSFQYLISNWSLGGAISGLILSQLIVLSYWSFILNKKKFVLWK
jgi:O-antigen/teichoic acid export membrane protein